MTREQDLPAPPYDEHVDLRGLDYMPLLIHVLMGSRSWAKCGRKPELAYYLLNIWTAAWLTVPAGSLENDDDVLRDASRCPAERWPELKVDIIRGFALHSDNRLYHKTIAGQVLISLEKREKWRTKKRRQRAGDTAPSPESPPGQPRETPLRQTTDDIRIAAKDPSADKTTLIVDAFHLLRRTFWPTDHPIMGADFKMRLKAQEWVDAGASVDFAIDHMQSVMQRKVDIGETSPSDLRFCGKSLVDTLARGRAGSSSGSRPAANKPRITVNVADFEANTQALVEQAVAAKGPSPMPKVQP